MQCYLRIIFGWAGFFVILARSFVWHCRRTKHPAPVVDDLVLCQRKTDEADLLEMGYEKLKPRLNEFGLGKVRHLGFL